MKPAQPPLKDLRLENSRLEALRRYAILDTAPEAAFERLTGLAARIFQAPVAVIDLLDEARQWFKSSHGLASDSAPGDVDFCVHAVGTDEVMVVPDARLDARFAENPLVTGETGLRFYAGAPLRTSSGFAVGVLAIMDRAPRTFSAAERATLTDLAALVVDEMELRLLAGAPPELSIAAQRAEPQRSQELFRSLVENAVDTLSLVGRDGTLGYQSPSIEAALGYRVDELTGKNAFAFIHPDDVAAAQETLKRVFENPGVSQAVEYRFRHQDGSWRVIESLGKTLSGDVSAESAVFNSRDLSARKHNEAELQKARDQLQIVLDTIPGSVAWIDADLKYHGVNRYLAEAFGRPIEAFIGQHIGFMNVSSQYAEQVRAFMAGDEERTSFEFTLNCDARARTFLMIARKYAEGHAVFVGTDITQRKTAEISLQRAHDKLEERVRERTVELADVIAALREQMRVREVAEAALRERERELRTLAENAPDIICRFDRELRHVFVSPAIERLLGLSLKDFVGKTHRETTLPRELVEKLEARLRGVFATGEPHIAEYEVSDASGKIRQFESRAMPEMDENGEVESVITIARDITERKQAEDELNRFFAVSLDMLCIAGFDGYFKRLNAAWEDTLGYSREELTLTPFLDFVHPEDQQITRDETMKLVTGSNAVGFENRYRCKDGSYKWLRWQVTAVPEKQLLYAVAHDITTRREAEEALRESETRFRQLVDQAADGLFVSNRAGRFINVNQRACDNLGYSRQELLELGVLDIQTMATQEILENAWQGLLAGETINMEGAHRRKDGTTFPVDVRGVAIEWEGEKSLFSVARDITQRRHAEQALRESEARKTAIFETAIDCIITIDHEGKVLEWNPAAEATFGFSRAEISGRGLCEFILSDSPYQSITHYLSGGEDPELGKRVEIVARRKDGGEILVEFSMHVIPDTTPPVFTAYLRDITERKRFDEALRATKTEAERANRAKSEFLSRMSHELRTPLNAILGFGQLLEMDELGADQRQGIEQILNAGRHLLGLINEVLDIARIESEQQPLDIEPVPAANALHGAMEMIRPLAASRGIELRGDWEAAEGFYVLADQRRLNQVLLNLLANAIKYNREFGTATLFSAPIFAPDPDGDSAETGRLRIAVSDSGPGIASENLGHLFTPFERLGAETTGIEGTGLGLALSKRLVEAMDGTINVQSTIGQGSTFVIELPLVPPQIGPAQSPRESAEIVALFSAAETQAVVLYIEDNLSNFGLVQNIFRHRSEIKLLAGVQGQSGIDLAVRHHPDLILLDFHLPDMNGDEVLRRLRKDPQTREIPVIIVSAAATPSQIERMLAAGAVAYVTKPLDVRHFLEVVENTLEKSRA